MVPTGEQPENTTFLSSNTVFTLDLQPCASRFVFISKEGGCTPRSPANEAGKPEVFGSRLVSRSVTGPPVWAELVPPGGIAHPRAGRPPLPEPRREGSGSH